MIIPKPKYYAENGITEVKAQLCSHSELAFCEKAFKRVFKKLYNVSVSPGEGGFLLKYDPSLSEKEYKIIGRTVYASSVEGGSYGLATLFQLLRKEEDRFYLVDAEILDRPDKDFRTFFSDLARKWHDYSVLLGYVDICYLNKIKYLQLKLTDNQSWTLPVKCFPNAATKGRSYTFAEIDYLVEYAHEANVEVIPNVNLLGHTAELIKNCPEAFGNNFDPSVYSADGLLNGAESFADSAYPHNLTCIGKPGIFSHIRSMYTEIAATFRYSPYIYIGCDEAQHSKWKHCPDCRAYMKRNRISSTKHLNAHYISKIIDICLSTGKTPIVAESFAPEYSDLMSKEIVVASWENFYNTTPSLLEAGFQIINMSWKPNYIVPLNQDPNVDVSWSVSGNGFHVYKWQHWWEKSRAYPHGIEIQPTDSVIGGVLGQFECSYEEEHDRVVLNLPMLVDRTWNALDYYSHEEILLYSKNLTQMEEMLY